MTPLKNVQEGKQLIGRRIKIIKDMTGHNIPIGTIVKISTASMHKTTVVLYSNEYRKPLRTQEVELLEITLETLEEDLKDLIQEYETEKQILIDKINFIKERKLKSLNEKDYEVHVILKKIEKAKSESEKEELLKQLQKQK